MKYNSQVTSSNSWSPSSNYVPQKHWQWFCDTLEADCNLRRNVKSMTCTSSRVTRMAEGHNTSTVFRSSLFNICSKLEMVVEIHPEGFWGVLGNHISRTPVRIFAIKMSECCYPHIKQEVFFLWNSLNLVQWGGTLLFLAGVRVHLSLEGKVSQLLFIN